MNENIQEEKEAAKSSGPLTDNQLDLISDNCFIRANSKSPIRRVAPKMKRNDPCPIDPYLKFKNCCGLKHKNHCKKMFLNYLKSINIQP